MVRKSRKVSGINIVYILHAISIWVAVETMASMYNLERAKNCGNIFMHITIYIRVSFSNTMNDSLGRFVASTEILALVGLIAALFRID